MEPLAAWAERGERWQIFDGDPSPRPSPGGRGDLTRNLGRRRLRRRTRGPITPGGGGEARPGPGRSGPSPGEASAAGGSAAATDEEAAQPPQLLAIRATGRPAFARSAARASGRRGSFPPVPLRRPRSASGRRWWSAPGPRQCHPLLGRVDQGGGRRAHAAASAAARPAQARPAVRSQQGPQAMRRDPLRGHKRLAVERLRSSAPHACAGCRPRTVSNRASTRTAMRAESEGE